MHYNWVTHHDSPNQFKTDQSLPSRNHTTETWDVPTLGGYHEKDGITRVQLKQIYKNAWPPHKFSNSID